MKSLKKFFSKTPVFVALFIVFVIIATVLISYFLVYPRVLQFLELRLENSLVKLEVDELSKSTQAAASLDVQEVEAFLSVMNELIPIEEDTLRFLTLNEIIAKASGVKIKSVGVNTQTIKAGVPSSGSTTTTDDSGQVVNQTSSANSYQVTITTSGDFISLVNYSSNLLKANRLIGLSEIKFNGVGGDLTAILTVDLPTGKEVPASPSVVVELTQQEKDKITSILESFKYSAEPAKNPLGQTDPFK